MTQTNKELKKEEVLSDIKEIKESLKKCNASVKKIVEICLNKK